MTERQQRWGPTQGRAENVALATLVALGVALAVTVAVFGGIRAADSSSRAEAVGHARDLGETTGRALLGPLVNDALVDGDREAYRELDTAVRRLTAEGPVVRVKVWDATGTILYSDEPTLVGQRFDIAEEHLPLLQAGEGSVAELSGLERDENKFEAENRLLEVYTASRTESGRVVLFETYWPYSLVEASASEIEARTLPVILLSVGILLAVLLPVGGFLALRLRRNQRAREALLAAALDESDRERRRIAAQVHDGVVQDMMGLSYRLDGLAQSTDVAPTSLHDAATDSRTIVRQLRSLLQSLYPADVPTGGLAEGLQQLSEPLRAMGIVVKIDLGARVELSKADEVIVLRTVREALRNVAHHADASSVEIRVRAARGRISLLVVDDGRGFSKDDAEASRRDGHLGLLLLADLAESAGGALAVLSEPGQGTSVRLELADSRS